MSIALTSDYVDIDDSPFDLERTDPFSMAIWIKTTATGRIIFSKGNSSSPFNGYFMNINGSGLFGAGLINTSGSNVLSAFFATPVNDGVWHHVGFSYDGSSDQAGFEMYVDGAQVVKSSTQNTLSATILTNFNLQIGARNGLAGNAFIGSETGAAIWDAVIPASGFATLYNSRLKGMPLQVQPSDLLGYWPLDDHPDGTDLNTLTLKDLSGNGNDGTGVNGVAEAEAVLSYPGNVIMPVAELPPTIHFNRLINQFNSFDGSFNIYGFDFFMRNNQLDEIGGSNKYILFDNVFVLQ